MTEPKFKHGDVVMLNSGGMPMTVCTPRTLELRQVLCYWHDARGELNFAEIPDEVLRIAPRESTPEDDDYVYTGKPDDAG